tara:strand:+ start:1031 stop:1252 length:222 start_codon:yes stop_codon:yes gene_type:complete
MSIEQQIFTYAMLLNTQHEHLCRNMELERVFLKFYLRLYQMVNEEGQKILLNAVKQILENYYKAESYEHKKKD